MKNLWLIPTDKPSRLSILNSGKLNFGAEIMSSSNSKPQNIYIINNEEIKEGDYCISHLNIIDEGKIHNSQTIFNPKTKEHLILLQSCKKIILTTDTQLIKDCIQAIDDEFLEWFVKNPSCEEVETERIEDGKYVDRFADGSVIEGIYENYKIIIPKEEPKQKRMYSEEEVLKLLIKFSDDRTFLKKDVAVKWFNKHKKKA